MAKKPKPADGPTMITVTSIRPHTYQSIERPPGTTYEVDQANIGAVVGPGLAMRAEDAGAGRRNARATPDADIDTPTPRRRRTVGAAKKAQKSRRR